MKQETIDRIRKFSEDRDWDQFHSPANLAKSIVIEAAELLECFLSVYPYSSLGKHTTVVRLRATPHLETAQRINI